MGSRDDGRERDGDGGSPSGAAGDAARDAPPDGGSRETGREEPGTSRPTAAGPGARGFLGLGRTVEVEGERRPVASLLRRGAALAVDVCFALLAVAVAIYLLSFHVPIDTDRAQGPMFALFGLLALYIVWLRDRGASRPGGRLRFGLSGGRGLLALRLVPVAGPRRFIRPVTVADSVDPQGETMRIVRAVLLGVAASLVALMLLGHAVSRTVVFRAVEDHAARPAPFAARGLRGERGAAPELAGVPSALVVGRTRAYVRVDAQWSDRGDRGPSPLEFFLTRGAGEWRVAEVRVGDPSWLPDYALFAPDEEVPAP